ncbi:MAG: carotenoid biosynthesis protein [Lewinellaceae bacterium]|nr:carotenoid biosynthesis protein [Lewinellaceae bacterium]
MMAIPELRRIHVPISKQLLSVGLVWLFYVSAMIGITVGFQDWFVSKTLFTLMLTFVLLVWNYPVDTRRQWLFIGIFFATGMAAEWVGIHVGLRFGVYHYGQNLGPKMDGVPWFIGVNWAVLVLVTGSMANAWFRSVPLRVLCGAALMVGLDFFMEYSAPVFDYWIFAGGSAPIENYVAWFGLAALLHYIFQHARLRGDVYFSAHLFVAQVVFFVYFAIVLP